VSVEALKWAYTTRGLRPSEHAILAALAWHHNQDTGRCDPSQQTLAEETSLCVRAVRDGLHGLAEVGLIAIERRQHQAQVYTVNVGRAPADRAAARRPKHRHIPPVLDAETGGAEGDEAPASDAVDQRQIVPVPPQYKEGTQSGKQLGVLPDAAHLPEHPSPSPKIEPAEQPKPDPPKRPRKPRQPDPNEQRVGVIFDALVTTLRARGWTVTTTAGQRHQIANLCRRHTADRVADVFSRLPAVNGKWPMNSKTISALVSAAGFDALSAQVPASRYDWPEEDPDVDPFA
jgi:hypothetical protein